MRLVNSFIAVVVSTNLAKLVLGSPVLEDWTMSYRTKKTGVLNRTLTPQEIQDLQPRGDGIPSGQWQPHSEAGKVLWPSIEAYIIGGRTAQKDQFPYQVALSTNGNAYCGGSLITTDAVLTAAHCVVGKSTFTIYLGSLNQRAKKEKGREVVTSREAIVHPGYDDYTLANDLAIIKLSKNVTLTSAIMTVSLPAKSQENTTFVDSAVTVSGFGLIKDNAKKASPVLKYLSLSVISNEDCKKVYPMEIVVSSMICTKPAGKNLKSNICNGDSGGPLVVQSKGRVIQVGIVSFGSSVCSDGTPAGYTRVTSYLGWISNTTGIAIAP